jgi:HAD superfamily hydrolase (TIGR01484 family)
MRFHVLATDYDGTIAHHGLVDASTQEALARVRASGRKLILVTGRELADLQRTFPDIELFDAIVAENGALIYQPAKRSTRLLAEKPPAAFVQRLRDQGVAPLSVGEVIVATWQPHDKVVLDTIRELGLELQVIFNKGAVMVLPSGINKAVGLRGALEGLGLSPHNAVAVGDAENDHAFLSVCECSVAVANALPALKERADLVTTADHGAGVSELVEQLITSDLDGLDERLGRHSLLLGADEGGTELRIPVHGAPVLVAGTSGGGKSTLASGLIEQLGEQGYQFCIVDPEGDFVDLPNVPSLGDAQHAAAVGEVMEVLTPPGQNASVNLLGVPLGDRPAYFEALLLHLQELRTRTGRPHWIIIDEAHHLLPDSRPGTQALPREPLKGVLLITVHPEHVSRGVLEDVSTVIAIGTSPAETLAAFAGKIEDQPPEVSGEPLPAGEAVVWFRLRGRQAVRYRVHTPHFERRRHVRKYAAGELGPDKSFFFRGPEARLNLRAQNLHMFLQVADGVDDDTWLFHLRRGDYSRWFRESIKDQELADEVAQVEGDEQAPAAVARGRVRAAIEARYTAAA